MTALPDWIAALGDATPDLRAEAVPPPIEKLPARVVNRDAKLAPIGPTPRAEKLERLVDKALDVIDETMSIPLLRSDEDFARVLSVKTSAAQGVVNMQLKADENAFRAKSADGLVALLATVLAKEQEIIEGTVIEG